MTRSATKGAYLAALLAASLCFAVYLGTLGNGFVIVDDADYILTNPLTRSLDLHGIAAAFTSSHAGWWMPLTWISFALDYHFWGLDPFGYHLTNILLHALNAGLVVLIAHRVSRWLGSGAGLEDARLHLAFLVGAGLMFGLHPLRVESVAWAAERKDVLNGFFTLSAVYFYLGHAAAVEEGRAHRGSYLMAVVCFALSLLAKSVSVVLPVILLMLDWHPLGRLRRETLWPMVREKLPFFAAAVLIAWSTLALASRNSFMVPLAAFPFSQRLAVSGNAVWTYVRLMLWPAGLSPYYAIPDPIPPAYTIKAILVALAGTGLFLRPGHRGAKTLLACFLLPLLPVLAFFQNGDQSYADRFTYLPSVAAAIAASSLWFAFARRRLRGGVPAALPVPAILIGCYVAVTLALLPVWKSSETYWNRVVAIEPQAITHKQRGLYLLSLGRNAEAAADFSAALGMLPETLRPYRYNFFALRGEALRLSGKPEEAVRDFDAAIALYPHPTYYYRRGLALKAMGLAREAGEDIRLAGPDPGPIGWFEQEPAP